MSKEKKFEENLADLEAIVQKVMQADGSETELV